MKKLRISAEVKLKAIAMKYYNGLQWKPALHDLYTIERADAEVFEIVDMYPSSTTATEIHIITRTHHQEKPTIFNASDFTTGDFGKHRVWIHPVLHDLLDVSQEGTK